MVTKISSEEFFNRLSQSDSGRDYLKLVNSCSKTVEKRKGYELHHIQPKALGGEDSVSNLISCTIFEHCKCHALLAKAIPCYKTLQPLTRMSHGQVKRLQDLEKIRLEEMYEWSNLRKKALHYPKPAETIEKIRKSHLGKKLSEEHIRKRTSKRVGTITVTDGNSTKYISPEELNDWIGKGWKRGISETRRMRLVSSHKGRSGDKSSSFGRKCIHKEDKELKVYPENISEYLSKGWKLGRSIVNKEKLRQNIGRNKGKIRITRAGKGKLIIPDSLQEYLDQGWSLGITKRK